MAEIKWTSQEEINKEKEEQEKLALLPTDEERIQMLEDALIFLTMER